ncbi:MAG: phage tail tape measure protein [Planctomycetaceae bacterium]|jgi:TP901 family phage tail tape measure protein|nr:phage tail tape measure protein [Planctomycetaceae bacterium]
MAVEVGSAVGYLDLDIQGFLDGLKSVQDAAAENMKSIEKQFKDLGKAFTDLGKIASLYVSAPIIGAFTLSAKSAIDFESAFAGVRKTVDASESEFATLKEGIIGMTRSMPQSAVEIAGVAEAAGQLGIKTENILEFSKTMVMLGDSTNMSSQEAATSLARFANIVQMSQTDFDKLGSVIVSLGNNLATTESEITNMGLRLAGAGKQIGLSEAEIMSFAGALSSVGIEAEAGGSAFSKVMMQMQIATETTGKMTEILSSESFNASVKSLALADAQKLLKDAYKEVEDAQKNVADAQKKYNDELEKTAALTENALSAEASLQKAQDAYNDAVDKFGEDSEQAAKAQERLDEAQKKYNASVVALGPNYKEAMDAQEQLTQAQDTYNAAVVEFGFNSAQALQAQAILTQSQEDYNNVLLETSNNTTDVKGASNNLLDAYMDLAIAQDHLAETQDYYTDVANTETQGTLRDLELLADTNSKAFKALASEFGMTSAELKDLMKHSQALENFANVTGMTADEFKKAFGEDAAGTLIAFIEGLNNTEEQGKSAVAVLDEMGITEVRMRDALLRAAGAGDVFRESLDLGTKAWEENTALTEEAEKRYGTMESRINILSNQFKEAGISIGEKLMPYIEKLMAWIEKGIDWFGGLSDSTKGWVVAIGLVAAAIGPVLLTIGGLGTVISTVIAAFTTIGTIVIPAVIAAFGLLTLPVLAIIAAIVAVGVAIYVFWDQIVEFCGWLEPYWTAFWSGLWNSLKEWASSLWEIGKSIVDGLWKGIQNAWDGLLDSIMGLMKKLPKAVQKFLGISSPSKLFADEIGKWIPAGIAEGFEDAMPAAIKSMQSVLDSGRKLLTAGEVDFDYGLAPAKSRAGGGEQDGGSFGAGQQNTGGNTYIFNSNKEIDAVQARREMEQLHRNLAFGFG